MILKDFIIVGGGIAGLSAIKAIREQNQSASILWISDEDRLPYKRTKINKHIAVGFSRDEFALVEHDWLLTHHVELLFDRVIGIETAKHELSFKHRGNLQYHKLIVAIGNKPRPLSINGLSQDMVFNVHNARQVENIIRSTSSSRTYMVVGAGVEGVETADQLVQKGKKVILVDRNSMVLQRFFTPKYAALLQDTIQKAGIQLLLDVHDIDGSLGESVIQMNGQQYDVDTVISTIGYTPNIELAAASNIQCNVGIRVDEYMQTSAEDVFAAGDVAEHPSGEITCLWHAAEYQGRVAGMNACGIKTKLELKPFRMKTEVFGDYYLAVLPSKSSLEWVEEEKDDIVRDMYFDQGSLRLF